jgi:hypothetical protein
MCTEFGVDSRLIRFFAALGLSLGLVLSLLFTVLAVLDDLSLMRAMLLIGSGIVIPIVTVAIAAAIISAFRVRLLGDNVQYVALGKFVLSEFPISHFEDVVHFPPEMRFTHRRRIRLLGMHPRTLDELQATLRARVLGSSSAGVQPGDRDNA